jgi:hypothetical protein
VISDDLLVANICGLLGCVKRGGACVDGPLDAREKMRNLTGGSIAIMCPALSTRHDDRWPKSTIQRTRLVHRLSKPHPVASVWSAVDRYSPTRHAL